MTWVLVFGAIALGGLIMLGCFAVSLWRKSTALLDEVGVLLERADELAGLLAQIEVPSERGDSQYGDHFVADADETTGDNEFGATPTRAT